MTRALFLIAFLATFPAHAQQATITPPGGVVVWCYDGGMWEPCGRHHVGAGGIATNVVSVSTTPTLVVAARTGPPGTGRVAVTLLNVSGVAISYGNIGTATSTWAILDPGAKIVLKTTAAIYGIASAGTAKISETEIY